MYVQFPDPSLSGHERFKKWGELWAALLPSEKQEYEEKARQMDSPMDAEDYCIMMLHAVCYEFHGQFLFLLIAYPGYYVIFCGLNQS